MTWNVTCTYSQFLAQKTPTCCVSLSSFYNDTIVNCPTCTCGCQNNATDTGGCVEWVITLSRRFSYLWTCLIEFSFSVTWKQLIHNHMFLIWSFRANSPHLAQVVSNSGKSGSNAPLVQCTSHMCPIRVHWHVKLNYKEYWRVKITITNFNYRMNYTQWNLVVQHPNFDNLTQVFSFNYKALTPYAGLSKQCYTWFACNGPVAYAAFFSHDVAILVI